MAEFERMGVENQNLQRIACPNTETFFRNFVTPSVPVILTNLQKDWKAQVLWSPEYFLKNFGDTNVATMRICDGVCNVDTYSERFEHRITLSEALLTLDKGEKDGRVVASPTDYFGSRLNYDYSIPLYCQKKRFFRSRMYMGPKGTVTSLHQDLPENLYTLVKGYKRITLFHPDDAPYLYRNPFWHRHPNFSKVDIEHPDFVRFPKFKQASPIIVDLVAGETLYIPALWWHHLRNFEPSVAMSFWWPEGWRLPLAWAAARYKALSNPFR